ncbi:hypothetical protein A6V39_03810 [Candidatus Mycoplasma haematobovis]|uniref:Uncharacterized protein n=1 Tax=Candidatus Mycoplasma haematobovis TaxID=432608 RepID=A0A1A9QC27_9MOLU|nr:hypothetical protein [Candidatus Mycoplasma haematobovis]OAL10013.1 hypothetical protein A6V39_03810 [Candidatus Mycoplasma haematobovis]
MPISKVGKIAIATVSAGGVSGGVAYGYHEFTKVTFKDKLGKNLIKQDEAEKWKARVATLKADTSALSKSLKLVKDADDSTGDKVKEWCEDSLKNKFTSEDQGFKEVQKYCTYNIKDKVSGAIEISRWSNTTNNLKLKSPAPNTVLSKEMTRIKNELTKSVSPNENALRDWCKATYEKPFKDDKDPDYLDASVYCVA